MKPSEIVVLEMPTNAELDFYARTGFEANAKNYDYFVAMYFRYLALRDQESPTAGQYKSRSGDYRKCDGQIRKWRRLAAELDGLLKRKRVPKEYRKTGVLIG
jgi:hypothetical protein